MGRCRASCVAHVNNVGIMVCLVWWDWCGGRDGLCGPEAGCCVHCACDLRYCACGSMKTSMGTCSVAVLLLGWLLECVTARRGRQIWREEMIVCPLAEVAG